MFRFPTIKELTALAATAALAACTTTKPNPDLPSGPAAYQVIPAKAPSVENYALRGGDVISVDVFGEEELSKPQLLVDNAGYIQLPLAGQIRAADETAPSLAKLIADRLGSRFLVNPQVSVSVVAPAKRYVSVEGDVKTPGVYEIRDNFTLLSALAQAQSPTDAAKLTEIVILRNIDGNRMAARFNVKEIRTGLVPDPEVLDGDVVTVGRSASRALWQDILRAAPIFNAFITVGTR